MNITKKDKYAGRKTVNHLVIIQVGWLMVLRELVSLTYALVA